MAEPSLGQRRGQISSGGQSTRIYFPLEYSCFLFIGYFMEFAWFLIVKLVH